jgi:hypothetical protein
MNRSVGITNKNEWSSRSHFILTVEIQGTNLENGQVIKGKINLVDLAGSERIMKSQA